MAVTLSQARAGLGQRKLSKFLLLVLAFILVGLLSACQTFDESDFTIAVLPDTQCYIETGNPQIYHAQTQWIVDNRDTRNIAMVVHLGDLVDDQTDGGTPEEWEIASQAMGRLETPQPDFPDGIPYGISRGNHDEVDGDTSMYNRYFGVSRFENRSYYCEHYGDNNNNYYEYFSAKGLDFIVLYIEFKPSMEALEWANGVMQANTDRRAIVVSHSLLSRGIPGPWTPEGEYIFDALKDNQNLFLMLSGHIKGTGWRLDKVKGHTIYTVMADYQDYPNGGDGWMRLLEFSPANNEIRVKTYSPTLNEYDTSVLNEFTLRYKMSGGKATQAPQ